MTRRLGRSSSTVNREVARHRSASGSYQPSFAEGSCLARRDRLALLERDERLERFVADRLDEGWSTEQETIYRFIYRPRQKDREALEAAAARQSPPRPAQAPRHQQNDQRSPLDPRPARGGPRPRETRRLCRRTQPVPVLYERTSRLTLAAHDPRQARWQERRRDRGHPHGRLERLAPALEGSITFDKPRQEASGSNPAGTEAMIGQEANHPSLQASRSS